METLWNDRARTEVNVNQIWSKSLKYVEFISIFVGGIFFGVKW